MALSCQHAYRGHLGGELYTPVWGKGKLGGPYRTRRDLRVSTGSSQRPSWQVVIVVIQGCARKSRGQSKTWDVCDHFLHSPPYNQGFLFFFFFPFALGNTTESDEEFGKRVWVPCAESSDEICEQGKNKEIWL